MQTNLVTDKVLEWLARTPAALANLVTIAKQFYADQGVVELPPTSGDKPHDWHAGDVPAITTIALSDAQIDALNRGMAEAWVKEKAIEFVKGFIMGVSVAV